MTKFPRQGLPKEELFEQLRTYKEHDGDWKHGRTWSLVYDAGEDITNVMEEVYREYYHANGNNPFVFRSLQRLETEALSMAADLLHGGENTVGSLTSCGSESLLMAVKAARDEARALKPHIEKPEMILAETAHAALFKAAHYLDVKPIVAPVGKNFQVDVAAVRAAVTPNTILLIGSAPQYPQGIIDPIGQLGQIALEHNLRFHVDACLGGFTLPFLRELGCDIPPFDFEVEGVSSISADLHKYGFAAKGVSAILYRDNALRRYQYFSLAGWPGGLFASPTVTGTRPGGAIATAWAALRYIGRDRYLEITRTILETREKLFATIRSHEDLYILGSPQAGIFAIGSHTLDVHMLADALEAKGWVIDQQANPDSLHFMVTPAHIQSAEQFAHDLDAALREVKEDPRRFAGGSARIFAMQKQIEDKAAADNLLTDMLSGYMTEGEKTAPGIPAGTLGL